MHFLDVTALEHLGERLQDAVRPIANGILSEDLRMVARPPSFDATRVSHLSHLSRSGPGGYPSRIARLNTATSADRLIAFLPTIEGSVVQGDA